MFRSRDVRFNEEFIAKKTSWKYRDRFKQNKAKASKEEDTVENENIKIYPENEKIDLQKIEEIQKLIVEISMILVSWVFF